MWVSGPSPEREDTIFTCVKMCEKKNPTPVLHELKREIQGKGAFPIPFQSRCNAIVIADCAQFRFVFVWYLFVIMISFDSLDARRAHNSPAEPNTTRYPHTQSVVLFGFCCVVGIENTLTHARDDHQHHRRLDTHTTCTRESKWERRRHKKKKTRYT